MNKTNTSIINLFHDRLATQVEEEMKERFGHYKYPLSHYKHHFYEHETIIRVLYRFLTSSPYHLPVQPSKTGKNGTRADLAIGVKGDPLFFEVGDFHFDKLLTIYSGKRLVWLPKRYLEDPKRPVIFYWRGQSGILTKLGSAILDYCDKKDMSIYYSKPRISA